MAFQILFVTVKVTSLRFSVMNNELNNFTFIITFLNLLDIIFIHRKILIKILIKSVEMRHDIKAAGSFF